MAFPLKSGADLYNQQLIRAAIWNYSAEILDPKEYVTGLIYFNTNPGSNLYQKLRFRTGTEWKTIAFEEDLDVANNAEFKALEDKVKLLAGEVDTDAIISNMKEVSNFLAGFAEDANLMSVLDGKLDKSGGAISGAGTIDIRRSEGPYSSIIKFSNKSSVLGYIGFNSEKSFSVWSDLDSSPYTLLHSGNIGEYAVKIDGSNAMKDVMTLEYANPRIAFKSDANTTLGSIGFYNGVPSAYLFSAAAWKTIAFTDSNVASAQALVHSNGTVGATVESTGIIKFASPIVPTQDSKGHIGLADLSWFAVYTNGLWAPSGKMLHLGANNSNHMLINSSGNVTIGGSDWATTNYKLFVDGKIGGLSILHFAKNTLYGIYKGNVLSSSLDDTAIAIYATKTILGVGGSVGINTTDPQYKLHVAGDIATDKYLRILAWEGYGEGSCDMWYDGTTSNLKMGSRLHVAYDIQADGNIVANGTIACKGIAAEGDAMDMVDKTVLHIPSSTTQQTFTLNHGLGTREITVSIYETTTLGTNMILTDVEIVDDNNISVSFGNPPSEEHMVVVMG